MTADFPVPRSEIPRIVVSNEEYVSRKLQMEGMVEQLVQEYEEYSEVNKRQINLRRWKQVGSRERCKLYRERPKYQTTVGALGNYRKYSQATSTSGSQSGSYFEDSASEHSYSMHSASSRSSSSSMESGSGSVGFTARRGVARSRRAPSTTASVAGNVKPDPQNNAAVIADTMPKMLMIGERPGRLEDAMHSLVARNHEELAFVVVFLHKEVADCAILHTMEAPTEDEPYRYLGYKWFVKPSPAGPLSNIVNHRDSLYIEYTGVTATSTGEVIGFHIMHSIDIDGFPDLTRDRNCVRACQSICSIYYQTEENMVEFFMLGNIDLGGKIPFKSHFVAEAMFGMPRSIDAGESKRLTELVVEKRRARAAMGRTKLAPLCRLCRSEKKGYNIVSLVMCEICGHTVCARCRVHKEVFESTGLLGRFNKFDCCKTCVVDISNTHLPTAKPQAKRYRSIGGGSSKSRRKASTRGRNWTATSETVYEDEEENDDQSHGYMEGESAARLRRHRDHHSKLSATSDSTVSTDMNLDTSFDSRNSMVSEISDFDRSFMIIRNTATHGQMDMTQRERMSRETAFSVEDLEDDWQPDFAKSQINRFSKSQINQSNMSRSQVRAEHRNDMVIYNKSAAGHRHQSNHHGGGGFYRLENQYNGQPSGRHQNEYETQLTKHHHANPRVHNSAPAAGPPNLQRNHSGGSDYTRDDLINRMQHLAQLAEETYHTTKVNETIFNGEPTGSRKQPVENRNRFFYY
jgi:hypothetical protein